MKNGNEEKMKLSKDRQQVGEGSLKTLGSMGAQEGGLSVGKVNQKTACVGKLPISSHPRNGSDPMKEEQ